MFKGKFFRQSSFLFSMLLIIFFAVILCIWLKTDAATKEKYANEKNINIIENIQQGFDTKLQSALSISEQLMSYDSIINFANCTKKPDYAYFTVLAARDIGQISSNFVYPGFQITALNTSLSTAVDINHSTDIFSMVRDIGVDYSQFCDMCNKISSSDINMLKYMIYNKSINANDTENIMLLVNKRTFNGNVPLMLLLDKEYIIDDYGLLDDSTLVCKLNDDILFVYGNSNVDINKLENRKAPKYSLNSSIHPALKITLYPHKYNYLTSNFLFLTILVAGCILWLITITLLYNHNFKRLYKPLGNIASEIKKYDNNSSVDEVDIFQNNFFAMKQRTEQLEASIKVNNKALKEKTLRDILFGVIDKNIIDQIKQNYGLDYLSDSISVIVVNFYNFDNVKNADINMSEYEIKEMIIQYIKSNLILKNNFEILKLSMDQFVIITSGYTKSELTALLITEFGYIEGYYGILLRFVISDTCSDLSQINTVYFNVLSESKHRRNSYLCTNMNITNAYYYPIELELELINYVKQGNNKKTNVLISNIIHKNFELSADSTQLYEFKLALLMTLKRLLNTIPTNPQNELNIVLPDISLEYTETELTEAFQNSFLQLLESVRNSDASYSKFLLNQIIEYIHANYQCDISLVDIAEHFEISLGYISKLFREYTDTSFKDYINKYRIDVAKKLISENSTKKFSEISEAVGFTNPTTFNRVFKKYELITPTEFRNNLIKK